LLLDWRQSAPAAVFPVVLAQSADGPPLLTKHIFQSPIETHEELIFLR
jgi:hypothetical protein